MKKKLLIFTLLLLPFFESYSQIVFEKGYFINENNQKIECLIKNIDWNNNPEAFDYMLSENAIIEKASIDNVKEFRIYGEAKYIRATVEIDRSSDKVNNLSPEKNPIYQKEQLFLRVLVEGKASLYRYNNVNLTRFFYKKDDSIAQQLVYKRYLTNNNIDKNNYFKQQLLNELKCQDITIKDVEKLRYNSKNLEDFFVKYNDCTNSDYVNYESKPKKDLFNLSFRPGLNLSSLTIENSLVSSWEADFDKKFSLRFGIEAEFILPFNKNKWSAIIEPTYQSYESEKTMEDNNVSGGLLVSEVKYNSIDLSVGFRHYVFLNNDSKVFANISYIFDFTTNSSLEFLRRDGSLYNSLEVQSKGNFGLGIGYKYMDRYSMEVRYHRDRNIIEDYSYWDSSYKTFSLIFGYSIF
jgi:hypothetical protein